MRLALLRYTIHVHTYLVVVSYVRIPMVLGCVCLLVLARTCLSLHCQGWQHSSMYLVFRDAAQCYCSAGTEIEDEKQDKPNQTKPRNTTADSAPTRPSFTLHIISSSASRVVSHALLPHAKQFHLPIFVCNAASLIISLPLHLLPHHPLRLPKAALHEASLLIEAVYRDASVIVPVLRHRR
ncbi:hypothetical protein J3F83DRAFT_737882 [Trichoderma novae-zelandiae]